MNTLTVAGVSAWLEEQGLEKEAQRARELGVDGGALAEFDTAAWQEIGVSSAVRRAQLIALVKKPSSTSRAAGTSESASIEALPSTSWSFVAKHGNNFNADGAAEHFPEWHSAVASANTNGAVAKNHVLGFLGMYNVLSLLVFTIAFTCLFTLGPIVKPMDTPRIFSNGTTVGSDKDLHIRIAEWFDAALFLLYTASAVTSFGGINATSIAYNTCSACSDANATALCKMPSFAKYLKAANDASIFGSMPLFLATILLTLKHAYVLVPYDGTPVAVFVVVATSFFFLRLVVVVVPRYRCADPVVVTHCVMFGGLMGETPVCPDSEADGTAWALRTPGELIEKFIFNRTLDAITAAPAVDAEGKRVDRKLSTPEIPKRVEAALEGYRRAALAEHLGHVGTAQEMEVGSPQPMGVPSPTALARRKLPFGPRVPVSSVVPVVAAGGLA